MRQTNEAARILSIIRKRIKEGKGLAMKLFSDKVVFLRRDYCDLREIACG
jgi:hypothetical protein